MYAKRQAGFTLVELAVVVFLIGLIASMGITALKAQLASAAISATKKKQEVIKDALVAYLARNRRLPCPAVDVNGGLDATVRLTNAPPPNCKTYFGLVPYTELGLPRSAALDGWDNFFSYAVSHDAVDPRKEWSATLDTSITPPPPDGGNKTNDAAQAFNVGNTGSITVRDRDSTGVFYIVSPADGAVVVLASQGVNGAGAYTVKGTRNEPVSGNCGDADVPDEVCNYPLLAGGPVPPLFQREYTENDDPTNGGAFDDIVMWYGSNDLVGPLVKEGAIKSTYGQFADQLANIKEWVIGQIMTNNCKTPLADDFPASLRIDPWGNVLAEPVGSPFRYQSDFTSSSISSAVLPTSTLYTIQNDDANQVIQGPLVGTFRATYQVCND